MLMLLGVAAAQATAPAALSLEFIPNNGQWAAPVRYTAAIPGGRLFLQNNAFTYSMLSPQAYQHHGEQAKAKGLSTNGRVAGHAYTVYFEHGAARPRLTAETQTAEVRNYFLGNDERHWASQVPSFRRLRYAGVWPGIDVQLYENGDQHLEYDFLLAPRANPARLALRYEGTNGLRLDAAGNLIISTSVATVTELAPRAWQTSASGQRQPVTCRYVLNDHTISFELGTYDKQRALTIDPVVVFSTYTGSTADNWGFTATYDQQGNLYSGGIVFGPGFPTSNGAFDSNFGALCDIALIKYNTQTRGPAARVWATYLGGGNTEFPHSLVTNAQGELVLLGSTSSADYPTTAGVLSRRFAGGLPEVPFANNDPEISMRNGADMVITRLNVSGSQLRASTFLGGSGNDGVMHAPSELVANYGDAFRSDVQLDGAGNVYVAASTSSTNFPGAPSSGPHGPHGDLDGILCKLPPTLNAVTWAAYVGGSGSDALYSVQIDRQGRVFASGGTTSADLATTPGAYHAAYKGNIDGFAVRYNAAGTTLEAATYTGTTSYDQAQLLQLDGNGNPYLFGQTMGEFPRTPGLYGNAGGSLFIQKLSPDLTDSVFSISFGHRGRGGISGRSGILVPTAFLVDDCERVYVAGWGGVVNQGTAMAGYVASMPVTPDAMQPTTDSSDFYLAEFTPGLRTLEYATFFGEYGGHSGEHVDGGTSRFDKRGVVYQAVCASCGGSRGFPTPSGAGYYSLTNGSSNCNNAAFKIDFQPIVANPGPRRALCLDGGPVALGGTPAGGIWSGPGVQTVPGGGYEFSPTAVGPGVYSLTYTVATTGICQAVLRVRYTVIAPATMDFPTIADQCSVSPPVQLRATPAGGTYSGRGVVGSRFDPALAGPGTHLITYTVCDTIVGGGTIDQRVVVAAPPTVVAGPDTTLCATVIQPFQLSGYSPAGGTWSGPGVSPSGFFTPPNTSNRGGVFQLTYTISRPPCVSTDTRTVVLAPAPSTDVSLNLPQCDVAPQYNGLAPFDCQFTPILEAPNTIYSWDFGDGSPLSTEATPLHRYEQPGSYRVTLTAYYSHCQVITQFVAVQVGGVFVPNIITPNGDGQNDSFRPRFSCQPASLKVFSRWGQEVYQTDNYTNNWQAENLAAGIYYYLLRDTSGRTMKGWVEVVK
jgi:gliding motility-associated-like protein